MTLSVGLRNGMLLVVVAAGAAYVVMRDTGPSPAGSPTPRPAPPAGTPSAQGSVAHLRLDELGSGDGQFETPGRDLFRFGSESRSGSSQETPWEVPQTFGGGSPPQVLASPVVKNGPGSTPIALKFIGLLEGEATGRVAVLSDSSGNVFYGREGDIIDGRYQMLKVGADSAELAYLDGGGRRLLRLSGQ